MGEQREVHGLHHKHAWVFETMYTCTLTAMRTVKGFWNVLYCKTQCPQINIKLTRFEGNDSRKLTF